MSRDPVQPVPYRVDRGLGGLDHAGVVGEPEVVVRAEHEPRRAVDDDLATERRADRHEVREHPGAGPELEVGAARIGAHLPEQVAPGEVGDGRRRLDRSRAAPVDARGDAAVRCG